MNTHVPSLTCVTYLFLQVLQPMDPMPPMQPAALPADPIPSHRVRSLPASPRRRRRRPTFCHLPRDAWVVQAFSNHTSFLSQRNIRPVGRQSGFTGATI